MSNLKLLALLAATGASLLAASDADAKPRRVVVLDFDGPRQLADTGRSAVMSVLGDQYNIIATKNWDSARARASGRGPQQWRQASKQAGVDAVIEGWVNEEGRHHVLTVAVRDASTGNEVDHVSVRLRENGVSTEVGHKLAAELDEVLAWIDGDIAADPTQSLPDIRELRPTLGAHDPNKDRMRSRDEGDDEDEADDEDEDVRPRHKRHKKRHHRIAEADEEDETSEQAPARDTDEVEETTETNKVEKVEKPEKAEKQVAVADDIAAKDTSDLVALFGPESKEAAVVTEGKAAHIPVKTPHFAVAAGPYLASRGMNFTNDPEAAESPPSYPSSTVTGFAAQFAVYPWPREKMDGGLSGLGATFDIKHSVNATLTAMDDTGYGDYSLAHSAWDLAAHYRYPIDIFTIDSSVDFGNVSYTLGGDFPQSVAIPDSSYSYLGAGLHVDLKVTEHASVNAGARYMYLLGAGMVTEQDWYGAGSASGLSLDGGFRIPLPKSLYVKGGIEYRRVAITFEGSGELTQAWGVYDMTDTDIVGTGDVGIEF